MNSEGGIFSWGPTGHYVTVNASGQIEATEGGPLNVFGHGETGRQMGVDANGRLGISLASPLNTDNPVASGAWNRSEEHTSELQSL